MAGVRLLPPQNAPTALVELRSGINLLRANGINGGMMTLDYANPFPLLMGFTPIPERFLSLDGGQVYRSWNAAEPRIAIPTRPCSNDAAQLGTPSPTSTVPRRHLQQLARGELSTAR